MAAASCLRFESDASGESSASASVKRLANQCAGSQSNRLVDNANFEAKKF